MSALSESLASQKMMTSRTPAFLDRQVICAYKNGTTYIALLEHVLAALEEEEPEAAEHYRELARNIPKDKEGYVTFDSECVEELTPVPTAHEFMRWYRRQLN